MSDEEQQLAALADAAPAPTGLRREHEIRRALDAGLAASAPASARRVWPWAALAVAAAAAAIWIVARPSGPTLPAIGQVVEVAPHDRIVIRTPDDSTVEASERTRFTRTDRAATRWRLDRGHLASHVTKRAPGETFEVSTPEATVAVVGTRFSVDRDASGAVATTRVHVDEGVVRVTPVGGEPVLVHAGEQWPPATSAAVVPPPAAAPVVAPPIPAEPAPAPPPAGAHPHPARPARPFDATAIRKTIRAGNLADARRLIDDGRKAAHAAPDLAELGILAAEAELAGRATPRAIEAYLAVVRDYPTTPQAEQALFAAAQLAFDRPDAGYRPDAMLRDYLDTYPHGQFAADAQRLLDRARK